MDTTAIEGIFFHAAHGHLHFPFTISGLYAVAANGAVGSPVVLSPKIGFCIADSFLYDQLLPNAGALAKIVHGLAKSGDLVVCLGAGNITQWAYALPGELKALG